MCLKKFHKMGFAVIGYRCHIINSAMFCIVFLYIFQDDLDLLQRSGLKGGRWGFAVPVGDQEKKQFK